MIGNLIKSALRVILILLLGIVSLILADSSKADEVQPQNQKKHGHFIRRWLTLGPIVEGESAPKAIEADYLLLATGVPEWQFSTLESAPKAGDMLTFALEGYEAQERIWKMLELPEATWDLNRMLLEEGEVDFALVYLLTFIEAKESTSRELLIGSNDGVRLWLNGRLAHTLAIDRPLTVDNDRIIVDLKKGINPLMIKVADSRTSWQFTLRFSDESGLQFYDTPERGLLPLEKRLRRLANYELQLPDPSTSKLEVEFGAGIEGAWKTYRHADGLASNNVLSLMQDKEGAIWIGTADSGVSWFDGVSWKTYTQADGLASNTLSARAMMQDKDGNIWVGTDRGLSQFDAKSKSWKTYTQTDGLASSTLSARAMMQDKGGNIWIGTDRGLSQFDMVSKSWENYTHTQMDALATVVVSSIISDRSQEGVFWVGTRGSGISRFDGRSWRTYTQKDGLADGYITSIIQDKKGDIWVGTVSNGVGRFDGVSWKTYTQKDGLAGNELTAIMQDKEGVIWFGTWGDGVSRFDGKIWKTYTKKNGLASDWVEAIMQDKEGNIWFGSWDGVSRFDHRSWHTYTQKDGLATDYVHAIIQDKKGDIWFGTDGKGLSRFDGVSWKTYTQKDGLGDDYIDNIIQDKDGNIWVSTWLGGLSRFDGVSWKTYTQKDGLATNQAYGLMQDTKGDIWVGMWWSGVAGPGKSWMMKGSGVSRFNGKSWKTYSKKDGLASDDVTAIFQDKAGNIWATTRSGGVSRFDGVSWKTYTQKDGLADNRVEAVMQDKEGVIWFGTYGGISRFDGVSKSWKTYTQKDGLANSQVNAIAQDCAGRIWIGTNSGGLSVFDGKCFQTIDSQDGLVNNNIHCIYIDSGNRDGEVWVGTEAGAACFSPNKIPPMMRITQIAADNDNPYPYKSPKDGILLKADNSRVALSYRAISFKTRPGNIKYFYKLVGYDSEFQGPTNRENVEYFNLKPGNYAFQVQAIDRDLNYSPIAQLQIVLPPLWHQIAWVRAAIGAGGLSFFLAFGLLLWRWSASRIATRRLEAQLREQEVNHAQLQLLRYQLNPHFLFNALSAVRSFIDYDRQVAKKIVTELSAYLRYSLITTHRDEAALRDEIEAIRNFLIIQKIRFEEQLETTIEVEPSAEKCFIPSFLIQPLVENAVKYGMQTSPMPLQAKIAAFVKDGWLQVEVANSGRWIPPSPSSPLSPLSSLSEPKPEAGTGIGIPNVKARLKCAFPERHSFEIFEQDGWVRVVIKIELAST